jgi:hypothetical protein
MVVSGMRKRYMVEVGLKGSLLRIEANSQSEAIRLAQEAVLRDGLLVYVQRMDEGEPTAERTTIMWRTGHEGSAVSGSRR